MAERRPDIVFFENVTDIATVKDGDEVFCMYTNDGRVLNIPHVAKVELLHRSKPSHDVDAPMEPPRRARSGKGKGRK